VSTEKFLYEEELDKNPYMFEDNEFVEKKMRE